MNRFQRLMKLHRLCEPEGGEDKHAGGGEGGGDTVVAKVNEPAPKGGEGDVSTVDGLDKHKPTDEEAKLLKDVMAKKRENERLREEKAALEKRFEGIDPEKVRAMLQEQAATEAKKLEEKGDWDRLKAQMVEGFGKERTTLQSDLKTERDANEALKHQIAELTVGGAFAQSKFASEELVFPPNKTRVIYGSHFEFQDGKVVGFDKPAGAPERTMLVNASGEALGFDDALRAIVEADPEHDQLLRSKMKSGAGSTTASRAGKPVAPTSGMTSEEKILRGLTEFLK